MSTTRPPAPSPEIRARADEVAARAEDPAAFLTRAPQLAAALDPRASCRPGSSNDRILSELFALGAGRAFVPEHLGGTGASLRERLQIIRELAGHSLGLALAAGINGFLFAEPLQRFGSAELQSEVLPQLAVGEFGGLMLTEPGAGTDALALSTAAERQGSGWRISGRKHWSGFTGRATYWLIVARERSPGGNLARDLSLFVHGTRQSTGALTVEERYEALGMLPVPYGRTRLDVEVPEHAWLDPPSSGVRALTHILNGSRLVFPAFAAGLLERLTPLAHEHAAQRQVGGSPLAGRGRVRARLQELEVFSHLAASMLKDSARLMSDSTSFTTRGLEANIAKVISARLMHRAASSTLQLTGGSGYRYAHPAGRAFIDTRAFSIFEGPDDVLCDQIALAVMRRRASGADDPCVAVLEDVERGIGSPLSPEEDDGSQRVRAGLEIALRTGARSADLDDRLLDGLRDPLWP